MNITKNQKNIAVFASKDYVRPQMAGVHFDGITASATDSFRAVEITNISPEAPNQSSPILVDARDLKRCKIGKDTHAKIERDTEKYNFITSNTAQKISASEYLAKDFPKLDTLFKEAEERKSVEIKLNASMLSEILDVLSNIGDGLVTLRVPTEPHRPLYITIADKGENARALLMPILK